MNKYFRILLVLGVVSVSILILISSLIFIGWGGLFVVGVALITFLEKLFKEYEIFNFSGELVDDGNIRNADKTKNNLNIDSDPIYLSQESDCIWDDEHNSANLQEESERFSKEYEDVSMKRFSDDSDEYYKSLINKNTSALEEE